MSVGGTELININNILNGNTSGNALILIMYVFTLHLSNCCICVLGKQNKNRSGWILLWFVLNHDSTKVLARKKKVVVGVAQ